MHTIEHTQTLTTMNCGECGIAFGIPDSLYRKARADHAIWFWCPNGHHIHFLGKSDVEKAQDRANQLERQLANAHEDARSARAQTEIERRRGAAYRGHLTRMRRRIANGVCPCCSRSFQNVRRHMETQHPDVLARVREDEAAREVTL